MFLVLFFYVLNWSFFLFCPIFDEFFSLRGLISQSNKRDENSSKVRGEKDTVSTLCLSRSKIKNSPNDRGD